jgi:hypothetical protein
MVRFYEISDLHTASVTSIDKAVLPQIRSSYLLGRCHPHFIVEGDWVSRIPRSGQKSNVGNGHSGNHPKRMCS